MMDISGERKGSTWGVACEGKEGLLFLKADVGSDNTDI